MRRIALLALVMCVSAPAPARELPSFFEGVRPLGMGGAFTAVSDDENALFYNPAGLDRVERWGLGLLNPLVEVNENAMDLARDAQDTDFDNTSEVADLIRKNAGEEGHARVALFPHFVMRHFAFGVLGQVNATLRPNAPQVNPELRVDAIQTTSGHLGFGFGFKDDAIRVGASAKYVKASRLRETYFANDIADPNFEDQLDEDLKDGAGFGFDLGAMGTLPVLLKPTVGIVVQNVGDLDLGDAGEIPQQVNLGVSASHTLAGITLTGAADWVDLTNNVGTDDDTAKRLHLGVEARLPMILSARAGLYQGYGSFGATLDLWVLKLDYASYAEELGSSAGSKADRRHVAQATLGW